MIRAIRFAAISDNPLERYDDAITASVMACTRGFFNAVTPATVRSTVFDETFLDLCLMAETFKWSPRLLLVAHTAPKLNPTPRILATIQKLAYCKSITLNGTGVDPDVIVELIVNSTTLETFTLQSPHDDRVSFQAKHFFQILRESTCESLRVCAMRHLNRYCWEPSFTHDSHRQRFRRASCELGVPTYLNSHVFAAKRVRNEKEWFSAAALLAGRFFRCPVAMSIGTVQPALRITIIEHLPFLLQYGTREVCASGLHLLNTVMTCTSQQVQDVLRKESTVIDIGVAIFDEFATATATAAAESLSVADMNAKLSVLVSLRTVEFVYRLCAMPVTDSDPSSVMTLMQKRVLPALVHLCPVFARLYATAPADSERRQEFFDLWEMVNDTLLALAVLRVIVSEDMPKIFTLMVLQANSALSELYENDEGARGAELHNRRMVSVAAQSIEVLRSCFIRYNFENPDDPNRSDEDKQRLCAALGMLSRAGAVKLLLRTMQQMAKDCPRTNAAVHRANSSRIAGFCCLFQQHDLGKYGTSSDNNGENILSAEHVAELRQLAAIKLTSPHETNARMMFPALCMVLKCEQVKGTE